MQAMRRFFTAVGLLVVAVVAVPSVARAGVGVQVTPGWAGYLVRAGADSFTEVRGRWVQPLVVCNRPGSAAAFWIGLGGATRRSRALEQVGTSADCSSRAELSYSAWYQLWPGPAIELPIAVNAGDIIESALAVSGETVSISLRDVSTGAVVLQNVWMRKPETTRPSGSSKRPRCASQPACCCHWRRSIASGSRRRPPRRPGTTGRSATPAGLRCA